MPNSPAPSAASLGEDSAVAESEIERGVVRKVTLRLLPILFACYVAAFLDRVNVSFAKLSMLPALGLTQSEYATGAGIFFVGYFLFEVPSNLVLVRVGARRWIARIMLAWGVVSCCMALVRGPDSFYALRFLLGAAEAGFFPGIIFFLTAWFPRVYRARAVSLFMLAAVSSFVIGSPLSGFLLEHPAFGLAGWQWLFVVEGLPSVLLGFVVLGVLPDGPSQARWLSPAEKGWLEQRLRREREEQDASVPATRTVGVFWDARVLVLSGIYFMNVVGGYGLDFFAPTLMARAFPELGTSALGMLLAIPALVTLPLMVLYGRRADASGDHAGYVAVAAVVFAAGLALLALPLPPVLTLVAMTACVAARWALIGPFWSLPTGLLTGVAAAGGIAWINSLGNLGGQAGPVILDWGSSKDGSFSVGLWVLSGLLVGCAVLAWLVRSKGWGQLQRAQPRSV
jgi:MFS transporter, ACS family, tartrate transporter